MLMIIVIFNNIILIDIMIDIIDIINIILEIIFIWY